MRRAVSLLEVLIAIFVTAVGLLAVASLIPVGGFYVGEANKSVRGWDLAQAATRQQHVRGMLDPQNWQDAFGVGPTWDSAFAIDPYFFAQNGGVYATTQANAQGDQRYWFPYQSRDDVNQGGVPSAYQVQRLTIRTWRKGPAMMSDPWNDANGNGVRDTGEAYNDLDGNGAWDDRRALIDSLFTGRDDTVFTQPEDKQLRPFPTNMVEPYDDTDSDGTYDVGEQFADLNGNGQRDNYASVGTSTGDYSWFITVSPAHYPQNTGAYVVSTVVCYKRPGYMDPASESPTERTVFADIEDDGRTALLYYTRTQESEYLNIKSGSWVLLTGRSEQLFPNPNPGPPAQVRRKSLWWCRVLSVGEQDISGTQVRVTLGGPDVQQFDGLSGLPLYFDENAGAPPTIHATIFPGVVNVFERTVEID